MGDTTRMRFYMVGLQPVPICPGDRADGRQLLTVAGVMRRRRKWTRAALVKLWDAFFGTTADDASPWTRAEPAPFIGRPVRDRAAALRRVGYPRRSARWLAVLLAAEDLQAGAVDVLDGPPVHLDPMDDRRPPSPTCHALAELLATVRAEAWPELSHEARHGRGRRRRSVA